MTGPGSSQRVREIVFLAVGASTPIGILAVNLSAYVMQHLSQFAVGIAVCALLSGLSLNGLTAWAILQRAERFVPQLFAEYRIWLVTVAVLVVLVTAVVGAYLTFLSMQNPRLLPNIFAVLTALWLLVLPVVMTFVARRMGLRSDVRPQQAEVIVRDA
jgi:peptidoglycan biosynthesis protein MviN/MurJ (putative lipid II flippase)